MPAPSDLLNGKNEPVAIVGMGCRWAGGIKDAPGLWQLLKNKQDGWRQFQEPRFSVNGFYHPNQDRPGSVRTQGGFLIDEDARLFDHAFFGITGREVETMDPSQRKLLEVVYEAFENSGETWDSISGSRTGVYIGNFALDHLLIQARGWEYTKPYAATGADTSILANRISYIFNLHGPSLATNTACSSSMYALHLAVSAIRSGDCDGAIVAAANWISDPSMQIVLDKLGALSPTSRCHTFDAAADGYARGEGYAAIYLKKATLALSEALPIRAMIRGTAINANGKTGGITRPSASGQEDVIQKAYENAGLGFSETTYFECHGTGTPAGDPLEVSAIGNVFACHRSDALEDRLLIGSVKPSLGHTEGASALASIMKVVLSLEAGEIPATYGVENLNPNIDFEAAKVLVVKDETIPWPKGKLRRASVNSFGFGGANGHCVIDHVNVVLPGYLKPGIIDPGNNNGFYTNGHSNGYAIGPTIQIGIDFLNGSSGLPYHSPVVPSPTKNASAEATTRRLVLLPFSAHDLSSLKSNIATLAKGMDHRSLADVAYTLGSKRSRLQYRSFRVVDKDNTTLGLAAEKHVYASSLQKSNVAFIFTGQGAQWHSMGAKLFDYAIFRDTISYLDYVLGKLSQPPSWAISSTLSGAYEPDHIQSPEVSQVACTAVQIALVDLLASWSIRPVAVVGHSSGEMAAAYASGYITAAEAIAAAYSRGQAVSKNKRKGAMLAVGLGADQTSVYIEGKESRVKIAAINSPGSVTLSGDADAIKAVSTSLTKDAIFNRVLRTSGRAYHSHHMSAVGSDYVHMLQDDTKRLEELGIIDKKQRYPRSTWVSSVKPNSAMSDGALTAHYWKTNLESPVRFVQAVTKMMSLENGRDINVLVEIGPHGALKGPLEQTLKTMGKPITYAPTLQRNEDDQASLLHLAGTLFANLVDIDVAAVNAMDGLSPEGKRLYTHGCTAVDLPTYQFAYGPLSYYESRQSKDYRLRKFVKHDLLGSETPGASRFQPQWTNILRVKDVPWLSDHRLLPDIVFPAAGFIAIAVEAATRVHQSLPDAQEITGYSFRKVEIYTALSIPEDDYGVEITCSMEARDTVTATTPSWVKFSVSSVGRDSNRWTHHCSGLVKVDISTTGKKEAIIPEMDARFPSSEAWYKKFADIGLGYGETFRTISEIQTDPHRNVSTAKVKLHKTTNKIPGGESKYSLHPTALDAAFQLAIINFYGGHTDIANFAFLPVHVSELYLKASTTGSFGVATVRGSIQGLRNAYTELQMIDHSGDVILEVGSMRFTSFSHSNRPKHLQSSQPFSSPLASLVWKPDIRTMDNQQIRQIFPAPAENGDRAISLEMVDTICCLVVFEIYETFVSGREPPCPKGEIKHWLAWIRTIVEKDERPEVVKVRKLSSENRRNLLQRLYDEAGDSPESRAAKLLHENAREILHEQRTGIDILVSNELLTPLYEIGSTVAGSHAQLFNILDCLCHANPDLRFLEIGAGTGAATRVAMRALTGPNNMKRYSDYTFTDISAGFLTAAKDMLSEYSDVHCSMLDIENDPLQNGYEPVYDVVLACEAIHATTNMDRTLAHCRSLLKPGGKLVLVETTRMRVLLGLLYGTLTGYWQSDDRTEGPFMELSIWQRRLRNTGFSGTDFILDDYREPHNTTSIIVATRIEQQDAQPSIKEASGIVYLLHDAYGAPPLLRQVEMEFKRRNTQCAQFCLDDAVKEIPPNARVVAFLTHNNDLLDADEHRLKAFQHLVRVARSAVWLTLGGMLNGQDPRASLMSGLLRVIATENPAGRFLSINIGESGFEHAVDKLVQNIVEKEIILQADEVGDGSIDSEFAWQDGCMRVSRVIPEVELGRYSDAIKTPAIQGFQMVPIETQGAVRATFETAGLLNSLYFRPYTELLQPLSDDEIEVKIAAMGLNWKDLILSMGRNSIAGSNLSSEYAGVVTMVGANVTGFSVGDRVYGMGKGHFGNYERVPAAFSQKLRATDDFIEAATMPLVYMSAVYAFEYIARLKKGQKVLIQSAAGGLGLAAIQVARYREAEIFATVGTSDKASFLANAVGIPADHIIHSRELESLNKIASTTGKGGFDVILCTSAGDSLYQSLKALAPSGCLIDVGRVDVQDSKEIGLELFQKSATFSSFDLNIVIDNDPKLGNQLIKTVDDLRRGGQISPIRPFTVSSISELDQTLLGFSKHMHIGKLVVSFLESNSVIKLTRQPQAAVFDPQARYVVTGGFGGLGRSIIKWMVGRGAHDFIILSRRASSTPVAQRLLDELKLRGVRIEAVACDVSDKQQVMQAFHNVTLATRPVKGVINAAMSLSDLSFDKLTIDQWRNGIAGKTRGIVNLHEATMELPLDFFVMLTSTETIWAPATQAAYIASDNFATYFARFRRRLGLPASTVSYGFVSDVGSDFRGVAQGTEDMYTRNLALTITERQALASIEPAFLNLGGGAGQQHDPLAAANIFTCLNPIDLATIISTRSPRWHRDGRVSIIIRAMADARRHVFADSTGSTDGDADNSASGMRRAFDNAVKAGPNARGDTVKLVTDGIVKAIAEMLFVDPVNVNSGKTVAEQGVDSLIAAELRNWFHQALRTNTRNLLDSHTSIATLAEQIVDEALSR